MKNLNMTRSTGKVVLVILLAAIFGCNPPSKTSTKEKYGYRVLKREDSKPIKCSFYIELQEQLSEAQITEIAEEYRKEYDSYMSLFIFYLLPDMEIGSGAWATSHYTPDLKITIYGISKAEEEQLKGNIQIPEDAFGTWYCSVAGLEHHIVFVQDGDKLSAKLTFKDESEKTEILIRKESGRFDIQGNKDGEYYIFNEAGNLELWDTQGLFTTAKKVE
jgi:hypothetical protein